MPSDILIIDDEEDIRDLVSGILDDEGHETRVASDSDSALTAIQERVPGLVFLDIWLQGSRLDGLELLDQIRQSYPQLPVIMISGHGNIETAVSAIRRGAYDFIEKPFKADRLLFTAERALETSYLKRTISELKIRAGTDDEIIGDSFCTTQLRQIIRRVAPASSRIMIRGPSGSGKEMVARALHACSPRSESPFVVLNAAEMTLERMETELFGIEFCEGKGKIGSLEAAHRGTLYIDEIADMPRETQTKILRVLLDQKFTRVGGTCQVKVDVRIICSTARDIDSLIMQGFFREDLYYRLAVVPVFIHSLAQKREDIPALIDYFMKKISSQTGIRTRSISSEAMAVLQAHGWPGNVRELRNNIERMMILLREDPPEKMIDVDVLPQEINNEMPRFPTQEDRHIMALSLREAREIFEKEYLIAQIKRFSGNMTKTAECVGMERSALYRKLKSLGVESLS